MREEKSMNQRLQIRLDIGRGEFDAVQAEAGANFEKPEPLPPPDALGAARANFVEPVSVIGMVTLAWIAKSLIDHWLKDRQQGLQIDLRKEPPLLTRLAGTPRGFVVIIDKDGNSKVHQGAYEREEDLMPLLAKTFGVGD
jgi:hypothetical protein